MKRFTATIIVTLLGAALFAVTLNTTFFPHSGTAILDPVFRALGSVGTVLLPTIFYTTFYGFFPAFIVAFLVAPENVVVMWFMILLQSAFIGLSIDFIRSKWHIVRRSTQ